jgi:hypothetical protein
MRGMVRGCRPPAACKPEAATVAVLYRPVVNDNHDRHETNQERL